MTQKQAKKLKRTLLGLHWDINIKKAKLERLSKLLMDNTHKHASFTKADYKAFFKSRRIKQSWV
jgi:hypothetical protein